MADDLRVRYRDLLTGSYDCVDRVVLNAFFVLGCSPGDSAPGGGRLTAGRTRTSMALT